MQSEFRQRIDELNDNPSAPAATYDATGRLLACPLLWETTLHARLALADGGTTPATAHAREDLEQPLHGLLIASGPEGEQAGDEAPLALRAMTMKTAAFGGALNSVYSAQVDLVAKVSGNTDLPCRRASRANPLRWWSASPSSTRASSRASPRRIAAPSG